jgi:formate/nitrite transporter FocA (FNT family)
MIENNTSTQQKTVQLSHIQVWVMSFACGLLLLFAIAAATRIPYYLTTLDYTRLVGTILFGLLALAGLFDNIRTHLCLRRLKSNRL